MLTNECLVFVLGYGILSGGSGSEYYSLGSPLVDKAEIHLENRNIFTANTVNQSKSNMYVSKVLLNGKEIKDYQLHHSDITHGGTLTFFMSDKPRK